MHESILDTFSYVLSTLTDLSFRLSENHENSDVP